MVSDGIVLRMFNQKQKVSQGTAARNYVKDKGCVLLQTESVVCTRDPLLFLLFLLSPPSRRRGKEVAHNLGHFNFGG